MPRSTEAFSDASRRLTDMVEPVRANTKLQSLRKSVFSRLDDSLNSDRIDGNQSVNQLARLSDVLTIWPKVNFSATPCSMPMSCGCPVIEAIFAATGLDQVHARIFLPF